MLSDAVIAALATEIQAGFDATGNTPGVKVFPFFPWPLYNPTDGSAVMGVTELDESDSLIGNGLRGNRNGNPDTLLLSYQFNGVGTSGMGADQDANNVLAYALTQRMRRDKMILPTLFTHGIKTTLNGLVIECGKEIRLIHDRAGPYDALKPQRIQYTFEATVLVRTSVHVPPL